MPEVTLGERESSRSRDQRVMGEEHSTGELTFQNEIIIPIAMGDFLLLPMDLLLEFIVVFLLFLEYS